MKKSVRIAISSCCLLLVVSARGFGTDPSPATNLLSDAQWEFTTKNVKGAVDQGINGGDHGTELTIRKTDTGTDDHVWWRQALPAAAGEVYHLSLEAKSGGNGNHRVYVGVEFVAGENKFLGFKQISNVCYASAKNPGANVPDVKDWTAFEGNFTVPPGATVMGIRLALESSSPAEADFRNVVLTKTTTTPP
jgi:hypothetical protein